MALPVGRLRIRPSGSDGGHNGIKSILYHLGSDAFLRLKIGVGGAAHDMISHVLGTFSKEDGIAVTRCIKVADEIMEIIMQKGAGEAMNRFNGFGKTEAE